MESRNGGTGPPGESEGSDGVLFTANGVRTAGATEMSGSSEGEEGSVGSQL